MAKKIQLDPPGHLRPATVDWWLSIMESYVLESHHQKLLLAACEAWDAKESAREVLAAEGMFTTNRFGEKRRHPACDVERDSRLAFVRILREMALDVEAPPEAPRPPRRPGTGV